MGQQQILLIVLSVILVGVAVAIGISMFRDNAINANRDAIYSDLSNFAANAYKYKMSSSNMGGGGGAYTNLSATHMGSVFAAGSTGNENASYGFVVDNANQVTITGTGKQGATPWIIVCVVDGAGNTSYTVTQTGSY